MKTYCELAEENRKLRSLLTIALYYSSVGVSRGPVDNQWMSLMEQGAEMKLCNSAIEQWENVKHLKK